MYNKAILYTTLYHFLSTATTSADTTTSSSIVTSDDYHLHTNSTPVSTDVTLSITVSLPASAGSGIGDDSQGNSSVYVFYDAIIPILMLYLSLM